MIDLDQQIREALREHHVRPTWAQLADAICNVLDLIDDNGPDESPRKRRSAATVS